MIKQLTLEEYKAIVLAKVASAANVADKDVTLANLEAATFTGSCQKGALQRMIRTEKARLQGISDKVMLKAVYDQWKLDGEPVSQIRTFDGVAYLERI